jgi:hypothetical protein
MCGVPEPQRRCLFSVDIGHDASKESENGFSEINGLLVVFLAERLGEALGENVFCVLWPRRCLRAWNRIRHPVHCSADAPNVARMVADTEFIFDQLRDFAGGLRLAFFKESLEIT